MSTRIERVVRPAELTAAATNSDVSVIELNTGLADISGLRLASHQTLRDADFGVGLFIAPGADGVCLTSDSTS